MQPDIEYLLTHGDGTCQRISLTMEPHSRSLSVPEDFQPPQWARLGHCQCANCPLDATQVAWCPVARNIAWVFSAGADVQSFDEVDVRVRTPTRSYSGRTTVQRALSSLFGLVCSLSDCPHTFPFRSMGVFHLPLSTDVETLVRASAFFLLRRYLEQRRDPSLEVGLEDMVTAYRNLKELNRSFVRRLRSASEGDAAVNAVILLDVLAKDVNFELESHLELLQGLFDFGSLPVADDDGSSRREEGAWSLQSSQIR